MAEFLSLFRFEVVLAPSGQGGDEGVARTASFSDVSGLELTIEFTALREGGYNEGVRQLIGKASSPPITLKRGATADPAFWDWVQRCTTGGYPLPYVNGEVRVTPPDRSGPPVRFAFTNAIATKVRMPDLSAISGTSVPIEELTLAHEGLRRVR